MRKTFVAVAFTLAVLSAGSATAAPATDKDPLDAPALVPITTRNWGIAVTFRFQICTKWLHLHCVMALRRRQGGRMKRQVFARQLAGASRLLPSCAGPSPQSCS
jgi:hypothetical protein